MVTGYTIRLARRQEVAALPDLERRALGQFAGWEGKLGLSAERPPAVSSVDTLLDANAEGRLWVAADAGGNIVGFALVLDLGLFAHLEELDVLPEHGRQGLGAALIEAVCGWAHTWGFGAVTLSAFRDVPWNAPFYARHGFSVVAPEDLPPELLAIVELERKKGLRTDLRVIMRREI